MFNISFKVGLDWKTTYSVVGIPSFVVALLLLLVFDVPAQDEHDPAREVQTAHNTTTEKEVRNQKNCESLANPILWLLLLGAVLRQTAGLSWAYNTQPYFQYYHPVFDIGW